MSRAYGYGQLNAKLNTIEALALAGSGGGGGGVGTLAQVLNLGNVASQDIDMNSNDVVNVNEISVIGNGFNGLITSQDLSFASDTTLQGAGMSTYADGANSFVQDVTGSFIQLQSSSDVDFAPYDKPMLQIVDVVADAHLVLTSKQLRLGDGGETSYPPDPPANSLLGTDASGNLQYTSAFVPTTVSTPALTIKAPVSIPVVIGGITYYIQIFTEPP
jgi:hypothetical protein